MSTSLLNKYMNGLRKNVNAERWRGELLGIDRDPVTMCKVFVRNVVVLLLALYRVFKNMKPPSFCQPCGN